MSSNSLTKNSTWKYFFIVAGLIALHAFFAFYQSKTQDTSYSILARSWGFNHIKFYSAPIIIGFYALLLILSFPLTNQKIYEFFESFSVKLGSIAKTKKFIFILLGIIASSVFYIFKNKYYFLGDYTLRVNQTMKQDFLATEYLTMKLLYIIATFLGKFSISPTQSFVIVSCASGGIFVSINCFIADKLGKNNLQKLFLATGSVFSGMLLIFCGYLDIYAMPLAFTTIYLYTAILYINNKKYFWLAFLWLIIAIAGHLLCVAFAPSFFIAWYYHNKNKIPFIAQLKNKTKLYTILALTFLSIMVVYNMKTGFVLPLKAPPTNLKYLTLLSFAHIWEFINGELLGCGVSFIIVFYLVYKIIRDKDILSIETYFLITASAGMILTVFLANLHRGSGDWDILSLPALSLNCLVILLLLGMQKSNLKLSHYFLVVVIGFNILNAILWIHINSTDKSISKIEDMLNNDPGPYYTSKLPSIIQLIYIYKENNLIQEAERISLKACNVLSYTDLRGCMMHAEILVSQKKEEQAILFYEELLQRNQNVPAAYPYLINTYQNKKQNEKILPLISKFYEAFKAQPNMFLAYVSANECLNIIEYFYNYNLSVNPSGNFDEMKSIITQLKEVQQQQQQQKSK